MKVLLLDNYDSFTYNIAHIFYDLQEVNLQIIKADKIQIENIDIFDAIIFSPGPDIPARNNAMERILDKYGKKKPFLGICLGLQAIVLYFGGSIVKLDEVVHGRTKKVSIVSDNNTVFRGINKSFEAGLYHSWIASSNGFPDVLEVTALSEEGRIMAIRHRELNIEALQFHPESIMTPLGNKMIYSWLNSLRKKAV
jgi:anthranilate synthase component 2